jgi:hypothetical protein
LTTVVIPSTACRWGLPGLRISSLACSARLYAPLQTTLRSTPMTSWCGLRLRLSALTTSRALTHCLPRPAGPFTPARLSSPANALTSWGSPSTSLPNPADFPTPSAVPLLIASYGSPRTLTPPSAPSPSSSVLLRGGPLPFPPFSLPPTPCSKPCSLLRTGTRSSLSTPPSSLPSVHSPL